MNMKRSVRQKKSLMRPNNILSMLRRKLPKNASTQHNIENAIIKFKKEECEGKSPLQHFFKLLSDNHYTVFSRKDSETDVIGIYGAIKKQISLDIRKSHLHSDILGQVSCVALDIVRLEVSRIKNKENIVDESNYGCYYRRTHGIPCGDEIAFTKHSGESITLSSFQIFWKKLDIEIDHNPTEEGIRKNECEDVWNALHKAPASLQRQLFKTITNGLYLDSVDVLEPGHISKENLPQHSCSARLPSDWENTARYSGISTTSPFSGNNKSRCSFIALTQSSLMSYGSNSVHPIPSPPPIKSSQNDSPSSPSTPTSLPPRGCQFDVVYYSICWIVDVKADGNCAYRAVALHIYGNENEWDRVRKECCMKLYQHKELYQEIMPYDDLDVLFRKIAFFGVDNAPLFNWMTLSEVGHIIATRYNVVLFSYGRTGGLTCLPVIVLAGVGPLTSTIVLGHVFGYSHFILALVWYMKQLRVYERQGEFLSLYMKGKVGIIGSLQVRILVFRFYLIIIK
ncbi:hypothetical protein LIER_11317 [Lithospermum erythrorhizon]|uniref:OTU domain-containing protein n=1 Tax=Lithospermum erythrorhizon TaxID=34254 RepID=A0AAV3PPI6_LITER